MQCEFADDVVVDDTLETLYNPYKMTHDDGDDDDVVL